MFSIKFSLFLRFDWRSARLKFLLKVYEQPGNLFFAIFKSADWAGQHKHLIRFLAIYSCVDLSRWTGALSSWTMYPSWRKCLARTGHKLSSKISWYFAVFVSIYRRHSPHTFPTNAPPYHNLNIACEFFFSTSKILHPMYLSSKSELSHHTQ